MKRFQRGLLIALIILALAGGGWFLSSKIRIKPQIAEATFAQAVEEKTARPQEPTAIFQPHDDIYLCFRISHSYRELPVRVEWYSLGPFKKISQNELKAFGSRRLSFLAKAPAGGWPAGFYQAKIYLGQKEESLTFEIKEK